MASAFLVFLGISALVIMTPGPDTALTIRNTLLGGRRAGVFTALGVAAGQLLWAIATSAGIVAVLLASEPVFRAVKLAGALYLIALGAHALWGALRPRAPADGPDLRAARIRRRPAAAFRQGVINNLGNPKMAVFFVSVLPQFAPAGHGMLSALVLLGAVFSTLTLVWLASYAALISALGHVLRRSRARRAVEGASGAVLIGLGLRVAAEGR
jgi:threonine/homoserine/homoserine lactone efflux protein